MLKSNTWVTETTPEPTARTGLTRRVWKNAVEVQFGADGPFDILTPSQVRPATRQEIAEKTGQ